MGILVAYLTHPLGPKNGEEAIVRQDNIASAVGWFRFLVETTRWIINCPWLPYVMAVDDEVHRPRALMDQLFMLDRSDLVVLTGGRISPHMRKERERAERHHLPVIDLTGFGPRPPALTSDQASAIIAECTKHAMMAKPRSTWMPPLSTDENLELQENKKALAQLGGSTEALTKILSALRVPR